MRKPRTKKQLALCIDDAGCPASLEANKLYLALPDQGEPELGMIRIVDESGEDYLYPADCFVLLPKDALSILQIPVATQRRVLKALEAA